MNTNQNTAPAEAHGDERAAFEAEMRCEETWGHRNLKRDKHGHYLNSWTGAMWAVWQARAALKPQAQPKHTPTPEDIDAQDWAGMDGATAYQLIERNGEDWSHIGRLMAAWLAANTAPSPGPGESYNDLFNALQRIDTAAVALPDFEVRHEGGLDAVVKNIVEAIERCAAKAEPDTFEQERQLNEVMELVDSLADESATKAYHGELRCRRKPHELRALILAKLSATYVPGQRQAHGKG